MKKKRKEKIDVEKSTVRIGKLGLTVPLIGEVSKQLDKRKTIKVKVLKTALIGEEVRNIALKIAEETQSRLVELRGHTFTLVKSKKS